jgi:hypothetical protein
MESVDGCNVLVEEKNKVKISNILHKSKLYKSAYIYKNT